jgi:flagellar secretion chaperone FliS
MSSTARGLSSYRNTQVQSRTPLELVVMLYDGALRFMGTARDAIERRDIPARRDALSRTLAIISELQSTLNLQQGGQVAVELDRLYSYSNARLLDAAMKNDVVAIDDVKHVFEILRDGWNAIATQPPAALNAIAMQPPARSPVAMQPTGAR